MSERLSEFESDIMTTNPKGPNTTTNNFTQRRRYLFLTGLIRRQLEHKMTASPRDNEKLMVESEVSIIDVRDSKKDMKIEDSICEEIASLGVASLALNILDTGNRNKSGR